MADKRIATCAHVAHPAAFPPDYVQKLPMKVAPPNMLQFKIEAKYMCIRNLDVARGETVRAYVYSVEWR